MCHLVNFAFIFIAVNVTLLEKGAFAFANLIRRIQSLLCIAFICVMSSFYRKSCKQQELDLSACQVVVVLLLTFYFKDVIAAFRSLLNECI